MALCSAFIRHHLEYRVPNSEHYTLRRIERNWNRFSERQGKMIRELETKAYEERKIEETGCV